MKIYLSGKITGDENYRSKFRKAAEMLEGFGCAVFNPGIMPDGFDYEDYMKIDFAALSSCDAIYLMDDWKISPGAIREKKEAERLGLKVLSEKDFIVRMTLLKLCDDMDSLQENDSERNTEEGRKYYFSVGCITTYVRRCLEAFDEGKDEEENFLAMYEGLDAGFRKMFYSEFIKEGYIQIEYDIGEEKPDELARRKYERMMEASGRLAGLLEASVKEGRLKSA